jgi:mannose-6-phosphate isomerase-like protein (cupin superfamily)
MKFVFSTSNTLRYRFPTHTNELVMDRSEAETSEVFLVILEPGESPPVHIHHDAEQIFFILKGSGILHIKMEDEIIEPVKIGDVVRIPPHTPHCIRCDTPERLVYLCVDCFVNGHSVDEPTWESHVRVVCAQNGWDFMKVISQ